AVPRALRAARPREEPLERRLDVALEVRPAHRRLQPQDGAGARVIVVAHRRNALADLDATPAALGVEVDVRATGDRLVVAHDPFEDGPDLDAWLDRYRHALLVVNTKEEGLAEHVLPRLAARGIEDFFL